MINATLRLYSGRPCSAKGTGWEDGGVEGGVVRNVGGISTGLEV